MSRYVALLRGINVGGNNLIKMAALKECLEEHGLNNVATFIASGNVLFESKVAAKTLVNEIEARLSKTFRYQASIVVRSQKQLRAVVEQAPTGFGRQPQKYRYNVFFLKEPLKAAAAIASVPAREGIDAVAAGPGVLYVSMLMSKASQSRLSKVISSPIYPRLTIRNWNTTTKLLALMEG